MARYSTLRASDSDRDRVAERLRNATAEGRILAEELEERLGTVFAARTYGELDAVVSDLPVPHERRKSTPLWVKATIGLAILLAVIAVLAVVALMVLGLASAWLLWLFVAWGCFGRQHGGGRFGPRGHSRADARALHRAGAGARAPGGRTVHF
jgi:hypothetical protein